MEKNQLLDNLIFNLNRLILQNIIISDNLKLKL